MLNIITRTFSAHNNLLQSPVWNNTGMQFLIPEISASISAVFSLPSGLLQNFSLQHNGSIKAFEHDFASGCSVGGGIAMIPENLEKLRKNKGFVIEHNKHILNTVVDITAEGSAAGYDSHGITLSVIDLKTGEYRLIREKTSGDIDERGFLTMQRIFESEPGITTGEVFICVSGAQTRAATQGNNMYSSANAHLHYEMMSREIFDSIMSEEELAEFRQNYPLLINRMGPFSVGHNGDLNSKIKWEKYFLEKGFITDADCDSKEIPRIERILYETLQAEKHLNADGRFISWFIEDLRYSHVLEDSVTFEENGSTVTLSFADQKENLIAIYTQMKKEGASDVAVCSALTARLITFADPSSIYVFETLTCIKKQDSDLIPVTTIVRGPKAGGMVLYEDRNDRSIPLKFSSTLANMRKQISRYKNQKQEEIPVDYIKSDAKVVITEGTVDYYSLDSWQMVEICANETGIYPRMRFYDLTCGKSITLDLHNSPIVNYILKGSEELAVIKASDQYKEFNRVQRTVVFDNILGTIKSAPTNLAHLLGQQVKKVHLETKHEIAVDNQYQAEILLSYVTLLRNTNNLFILNKDAYGNITGDITLNTQNLFNIREDHLSEIEVNTILKKITTITGCAEGTSRNIFGLAASACNFEGLSAVSYQVFEANLARMEKPNMPSNSLLTFVSNSGSTKPVIALAEEILETKRNKFSGPHIWAVTNIITSELAQLANSDLGASITNLPWEKAVGSTFAAFTALQNILAMVIYLHEIKGHINPKRAQYLYKSLVRFPEIARATLSFTAAKKEVQRLANYISANNIDISYVGAWNGYDACEGALKFAEMVQHTRVKFFSGAYEQHGQRATYTRHLHANPGSLVVIHIPNLELSVGSWMAQLIKEDRPRAGKIAVICAEEDALKLKECGADFVIPAPAGTTDTLFTDVLTKLIIDNMIAEATIESNNRIASIFINWGSRLLNKSAVLSVAKCIDLKEYLGIIRKKFVSLISGGYTKDDVYHTLLQIEEKILSGSISLDEKEELISEIYNTGRIIKSIPLSMCERIADLIDTLIKMPIKTEEDTTLFSNLLNDLILEFSDRNLAMQIADEKFSNDPQNAKQASHYQGVGKLIGSNPIKPDNIAKFQQGWGIASFLLPPGQRKSDYILDSRAVCSIGSEDMLQINSAMLETSGFKPACIEMAQLLDGLFQVRKEFVLNPIYVDGKFVSFSIKNGRDIASFIDKELIQQMQYLKSPEVIIKPVNKYFAAGFVFLDKYGDISHGRLFIGNFRAIGQDEKTLLYRTRFFRHKLEFIYSWLNYIDREIIDEIIPTLEIESFFSLTNNKLIWIIEERMKKRELIRRLPLAAEIAEFGVDLYQVSLENLMTLRNISHAIVSIKGGAVYEVEKRITEHDIQYYGKRLPETCKGFSAGKSSRYDSPGPLKGNKKLAASEKKLNMGYGKDKQPIVILPVKEYKENFEILLLHPEINDSLGVEQRKLTLGKKYQFIMDHVSEYMDWNDDYMLIPSMTDLMMYSDEEISAMIIDKLKSRSRENS